MDRELEKLKSARSKLDAVIAGKERSKTPKTGVTMVRPNWTSYGRKDGRTITKWDAHGRHDALRKL